MSGVVEVFTILAAVAAIVSGFHAAAELERHVREKRAKAKRPGWRNPAAIEHRLCKYGSLVRKEYKKGYRELGASFSKGDSTGIYQLQKQMVIMQKSIIMLLQKELKSQTTVVDLVILVVTSKKVQYDTQKALIQQFQRISVSKPLNQLVTPRQTSPWDWITNHNSKADKSFVSKIISSNGSSDLHPTSKGFWHKITRDDDTSEVSKRWFTILSMTKLVIDSKDNPKQVVITQKGSKTLKKWWPWGDEQLPEKSDEAVLNIVSRDWKTLAGKFKALCGNSKEEGHDVALVEGEVMWVKSFITVYQELRQAKKFD
ncbi:Fc.00g071550.m01.CDS01 [Cosmosporella sp. VM-42]